MLCPSFSLVSIITITNIIQWQKFLELVKLDKSLPIVLFFHFAVHQLCRSENHLVFLSQTFQMLPSSMNFPRSQNKADNEKNLQQQQIIFWIDQCSSITQHFLSLTNCHNSK